MKKLLLFLFTTLCLSYTASVFATSNYNVYNSEIYNLKNKFADDEKILFIVDYSESMVENIGQGRKIDIALNTLSNIIPRIPQSTQIGLRVYGHKSGFTMLQSCRASNLVLPPTKYSGKMLLNSLYHYKPTGWTPITYSLKEAVNKDFANIKGNKRIILLTDGGENCDESPCTYALKLIQLRDDIKIDVIAFAINDEDAINQLKCAAYATSGKFFTADNPTDLLKSFEKSLNIEKSVDGVILK